MFNIENKKIPITLIIIGVAVLVITYLIKEPYDFALLMYYEKNHTNMPLSDYYISILSVDLSLKAIVITSVLLISVSVYLLMFKSDEEIKAEFMKYKGKFMLKKGAHLKKLKEEANPHVNIDNVRMYKRVRISKFLTLFYGITIVIIIVITKVLDNDLVASFTLEEYQTYSLILLIANLVNRAFAAQVCYDMAKYNKGNKWLWTLLGLIMPSITLILAGIKRTLQNEYKYLLNYYN